MKYRVSITRTEDFDISVEADSEEEAEEMAYAGDYDHNDENIGGVRLEIIDVECEGDEE